MLWQLYLVLAWFPITNAASPLLRNLYDYTQWSSQVRSCSMRDHKELQCEGVMWRSKVLLVPAPCVNGGETVLVHRSVVLGEASCDYIANARNTESRRAVDIHVHPRRHESPAYNLAMVYLDEPFRNIYEPKTSEVDGFHLIEDWLQECIAISEAMYDIPKLDTEETEAVYIFPKLTSTEAIKLFVTAIVLPLVLLLLVFYLIMMYPDYESEVAYKKIMDDFKSESETDVYKTYIKT